MTQSSCHDRGDGSTGNARDTEVALNRVIGSICVTQVIGVNESAGTYTTQP